MNATTQLETVNVTAEKFVDWAISSRALQECSEGSTTSTWSPERTVKCHECGTSMFTRKLVKSPSVAIQGEITMPKFTANIEDLKAAYELHKSPQKVADHFGVSKKSVLNYMKKFGIARDKRRLVTAEAGEVIRTMAANGCGSTEISKAVGYTSTTIRRWANQYGIEIKDVVHTGRVVTHAGYVKLPNPTHPRADSKGYVMQHVLVMEAHIGRFLNDGETVHHVDYSKGNNRIENLQLMSDSEHRALHMSAKDCGRWVAAKRVLEDIV